LLVKTSYAECRIFGGFKLATKSTLQDIEGMSENKILNNKSIMNIINSKPKYIIIISIIMVKHLYTRTHMLELYYMNYVTDMKKPKKGSCTLF